MKSVLTSLKTKLMISRETMRYRKVRRILRYRVLNKLLAQEKFAHHVLLLFYPFRDEKELLSGFPPLYQNKLGEQGVQAVVNMNKIKLKPYDDLVDQGFSQFDKNSIKNQDSQIQVENDETPGAEYPNENDSEDTETSKPSAVSNFMPKILPNEIAAGTNSLNLKQREVFNVFHTWAKDYVKYNWQDAEPVHIFLSGTRGTGKSRLVKYQKHRKHCFIISL